MSSPPEPPYDAVIVVSFGGPEGPDDVMPFLDNVLRGRPVRPERLAQVAEHYLHFGGVSPINGQNRALVAAVGRELADHAIDLPVYWGNRNWHPFLVDTVAQMAADGVRRALAFVTSAYASASGCHQYLDDIARARVEIGPGAPVIDKLRVFFNHPGFVEPWVESVQAALDAAPGAPILFSAHSIPVSMAEHCDYQTQLLETAELIAARVQPAGDWELVYQSRSGPPEQPWLEPDVADRIRALPAGTESVVVAPIGFVSDHMEVVYDLDTEAAAVAGERGIRLVRATTPGTHPRFVAMIRQLLVERLEPLTPKLALGTSGAYHDTCLATCCPIPSRAGR